MKIYRILLDQLAQYLIPGKVLVLYGPRQVGKTTLTQDLMERLPGVNRYINADELAYREALASQDRRVLGDLVSGCDLLVIDEAQRVANIGLNLKIMVDNYPQARILATGSASFDLANQISEPLTGRKLTFTLYPISYGELAHTVGAFEARAQLERWLVWGGYPTIITEESAPQRERLLDELVGSYLYRDILVLEGVRRADRIVDLLRLLAFQIGQEVSVSELAKTLGMNWQTVNRYLDLLEKVFVLFRVQGFARNLRKEITKNARYYFYDNGVRNSLIRNFNPLTLRNDVGQLWENYIVAERRKANAYAGRQVTSYFWRTHEQHEIDCIEEWGGHLEGYEFKWQGEARPAAQRAFVSAYPEARVQIINRDNFVDFLSGRARQS